MTSTKPSRDMRGGETTHTHKEEARDSAKWMLDFDEPLGGEKHSGPAGAGSELKADSS